MEDIPCKLCRKNAVSASGGKYCVICYKELIINTFIIDYPISTKELIERWRVKDA